MSLRDAYQKKFAAQLDEWKAGLDQLKARAGQSAADAEIASRKRLDALQDEYKALQKKLADMSQAGDSAWDRLQAEADELRARFDGALAELKRRFQ